MLKFVYLHTLLTMYVIEQMLIFKMNLRSDCLRHELADHSLENYLIRQIYQNIYQI